MHFHAMKLTHYTTGQNTEASYSEEVTDHGHFPF